MSVIQNALVELNVKLETLEKITSDCEVRVAARATENKTELFGDAVVNGDGKDNGIHSIDPAIVTKQLDVTIERIEKMLKEG